MAACFLGRIINKINSFLSYELLCCFLFETSLTRKLSLLSDDGEFTKAEFVAPKDGLYYFNVNFGDLDTPEGQQIDLVIEKSTKSVTRFELDTTRSSLAFRHQQKLSAGDKVWISAEAGTRLGCKNSFSFSGYMIE